MKLAVAWVGTVLAATILLGALAAAIITTPWAAYKDGLYVIAALVAICYFVWSAEHLFEHYYPTYPPTEKNNDEHRNKTDKRRIPS